MVAGFITIVAITLPLPLPFRISYAGQCVCLLADMQCVWTICEEVVNFQFIWNKGDLLPQLKSKQERGNSFLLSGDGLLPGNGQVLKVRKCPASLHLLNLPPSTCVVSSGT